MPEKPVPARGFPFTRAFLRRAWPRWATELLYALLVVAAAALALSPVLRRSGWPLNQGSTGPLLLVQLYASHFRHLDFFPVWSSSDAFGMGSPVLLYYHRTYFYVAGLLMAFGGLSLKASVVTTIGLFLVVGAYGMRRALRVVTDDRLLYTVGSLGFLFTNYVFTDWLYPRGDLAEFSAVMLVPWLLWWCLVFVKDQRFSYLLIPIVVILVNTHSAIALTAPVRIGRGVGYLPVGRRIGGTPGRPLAHGHLVLRHHSPPRAPPFRRGPARPVLRSADQGHGPRLCGVPAVRQLRCVLRRHGPSLVSADFPRFRTDRLRPVGTNCPRGLEYCGVLGPDEA